MPATSGSIIGTAVSSATTAADGTYTVQGLASGSYTVQFIDQASHTSSDSHSGRWYTTPAQGSEPALVTVTAPASTSGIDASLDLGGSISGTISAVACSKGDKGLVRVTAYDATSGKVVASGLSDGITRGFHISGLPSGTYKLEIDGTGAGFARQWYRNAGDRESAAPVAVTAPAATNGLEVVLSPGGGSVSGRVTDAAGNSVSATRVSVYDGISGGFVARTSTDADGRYTLKGLATGAYRILFSSPPALAGRWYNSQAGDLAAGLVNVTARDATTGIDAVLTHAPDGDLDGDAATTITDVLLVLRMAVGIAPLAGADLGHGDVAPVVDGDAVPDGHIDLADALTLLRRAVGIAP